MLLSAIMDLLLVLRDGHVVRALPLDGNDFFVGRDETCALVLDHTSVSRKHARLFRSSSGWVIRDEGSTNGLMLDDRFATSGELGQGHWAQVGVFTLELLALPAGTAPVAGPANPAGAATDLAGPHKALEALFLLSSEFSTLLNVGDLLEKMIDCLLGIFRAERGFILLYHPRTGKLEPAIVRKMDRLELSNTVSMTVALHAAAERKPVLIDDLTASARFQGALSIERERIRSILAAPLLDGEEVLGVVYLDSQMASRKFAEADCALLETFCGHAAGAVRNAKEKDQLRRDLFRLKALESERERFEFDAEHIVGCSRPMLDVHEQIRALGAEEVSTLILGESGTGKELVARAIHTASPRRDRPFVAVNCMALSPTLIESELFGHEKGAFSGAVEKRIGRFEMADGGTLFLDEIGELSLEIQVKLLRVLQQHEFERVGSTRTQEVDVRIVAATNADLQKAIAAGKFREDLYYRLNVFTIRMPALRERREDIPSLAEHFVRLFESRRHKGISALAPDAMEALISYGWPGNVRELRNVIERAFVLESTERIRSASLPAELTHFRPAAGRLAPARAPAGGFAIGERDLNLARTAFEKAFIQQALARHNLNVTAAAEEMGLPRKSLYRKLEAYGIDLASLQADQEKEERNQILAALRRNAGNVTAASADLGMPRPSLYRKMDAYGIDPKKCF